MLEMHYRYCDMPVANNGESPMVPSGVKLSAIDLNLLVVFDALMQDRNVTRAGDRLGLSQPAMSHALARLRHMVKDDLFIRSPKGMVPTPRAEELAAPVRAALDGLRHSLEPAQFDPSTATRNIRIAVDNYAARVLVAPLAARIVKLAPLVTLDFRPLGTLEVPDLLDRDELDLVIGPLAEQGERFSRQPLLDDKFVVVLRKNHPAAKTREMPIEKFAALPHIEITSASYATAFIDEAVARHGLARRVALQAPFLSLARILVTSDMVSTLPRRAAEELVRYRQLVIRPLPCPSPTVEIAMIWARRFANQPANRWLRDVVGRVAKGLRLEDA
jgi:DNA-binding transcriptional LysR family regulator